MRRSSCGRDRANDTRGCGRREGKSLGRLASEVLGVALAVDAADAEPAPLAWSSRSMAARLDLEDKEALRRALGEA